jgi:hypothetical protein
MNTPVDIFAGQTLDETLRSVPVGSVGSEDPERNVLVDVEALDLLLQLDLLAECVGEEVVIWNGDAEG